MSKHRFESNKPFLKEELYKYLVPIYSGEDSQFTMQGKKALWSLQELCTKVRKQWSENMVCVVKKKIAKKLLEFADTFFFFFNSDYTFQTNI